MSHAVSSQACFAELPREIALDIYHYLDIGSVFKLSIISKHFLSLFKTNRVRILLHVLAREFSPFDEFLQVYTASQSDIDITNELYHPRRVIFKRFPGDEGQFLTPLPQISTSSARYKQDGFIQILEGRRLTPETSKAKTVVLTERDLSFILQKCKIVKQWEELFPQMRWFHKPENCRPLRPHENMRFRRAFYRWWLYGIYFHGEFPRPRIGLPEPHVGDIRTSQMRYHSTSELLELMDLIETIKDVILHYICPRLDLHEGRSIYESQLVHTPDRRVSLATSWSDQSCWGRIVKTYVKLGPESLMYYFENICSYPRKRLLTEIRLHCPNFVLDQESIQIAIRCTLDERQWQDKAPSLAENSAGGILDFGDERDDEREVFGSDGSGDGSLPPGIKPIQSFSRYSPRGDDGSYLEEILYYEREADSLSLQ